MTCQIEEDQCLNKGDTFTSTLTITDENDDPVDITGWEVHFLIKNKKTDEDSEAVYTMADTTPTDPTNGITVINVPDENSAALQTKAYYYFVRFVNTSGESYTLLKGEMNVTWGSEE